MFLMSYLSIYPVLRATTTVKKSFCPMLAVRFIDTLYANSTCSYKLEQLQVHLDYVLLNMKHRYSHFMFSDETVSFKEFRKRCSTSLFCSQTNINDYFK